MYRKYPKGIDPYETPEWATEALMEREKFNGTIWEPACGKGKMSKILEKYNKVFSSDLYDHKYGERIDFLQSKKKVNNIITNPPYSTAENFVFQALRLAKCKVALLLRIKFLASRRRYKEIYLKTPIKRVLIFCRRVGFENPLTHKKSTMIVYCWVIWDKQYKGKPLIDWIGD